MLFLAGCGQIPESQRQAGQPVDLLAPGAVQYAQNSGDESDILSDEDAEAIYGSSTPVESDDPLELLNRFVFAFNEALDVILIRPMAVTYRDLFPDPVKDSVRNFLRHLRSPVIFANDLLQGNPDRASDTAARFFINTAFGLGFFDPASELGHPYHDEDFGQTMATYGAGEGAYIVLPVLGPSSLRDTGGRVVDMFFDPLTYLLDGDAAMQESIVRAGVKGLDYRSRNIENFDEIMEDSVDPYARFRSLWRQNRQYEIENRDNKVEGLN
ncbi:VacJ family lipoprotein [Fodinicurvata halophila]|uniref:VacJ family lipoprotein n=1 Tax=Fodinicurvata halophila TaxID=1419723 RepID=A0ABV8UIT8_9PROT